MSNTSLTTKVSQSRGWTLALGIGAAALAAILLIAYLVQYRSSVNDSTAPTPVLVAKNLIPKGTSGIVIAEKQLFQAATLAKDDLKVGAISDPAYLNGRVAVADIFPGQQITTADLERRPDRRDPDAALRASSAPSRSPSAGARGLVGYVASGDRVDIYYETGAQRRHRPRPPRAERPRDARAGGRGPARDPARRRRHGAEARPRGGHRHALVPPPPGGRRQERRRRSRSRAPSSSPRSTGSGRRDTWWSAPFEHSSPSRDSTPSTSSGRCPTTRASSCSG